MIKMSNNEVPHEGEVSPTEAPLLLPEHTTLTTRDRVDSLGLDLSGTSSVHGSMSSTRASLPTQSAPVPASNESVADLQEFREILSNIGDLSSELVSINMEHRVGDIRDAIPIIGNLRSHSRATREGDVITDLKQELADLQNAARKAGLDIDLSELESSIAPLKVPGGLSKLFGSVTLLRGAHRSFFAPRAENIRSAVTNVRRAIRA